MSGVLIAIAVIPIATTVAAWWVSPRSGKVVTILSGCITFLLALALVGNLSRHQQVDAGPLLRVDALSLVFLLAASFLYATTSVFAAGYVKRGDGLDRRYSRRLFAGFNLFAWATVIAPIVNGLSLLWVAIEVTTVISALLVAIDDTDRSTEAAWKYVLVASLGLGIALLATIVMYYAGSTVLGGSYGLGYTVLLAQAHRLPPGVVRLAYMLAVLGFGTKMGLVPVHTWLPDAHSEAPTPVSALLSGSLLAVSFYAILRYFEIAERAIGPTFARNVLLVFGTASLLLAALYLLSQRDLKRLLAYSSVEHMGILAIGMSFAAPIAIVGVLLHVLSHAAAKGTAFFGAGSVLRKLATKDMTRISGGVELLPWSGPMLIVAVLALSAMPPFGIFRSEFLIVAGGLRSGDDAFGAVLVVLVTLAFLGLSWFTTQTMFSRSRVAATKKGETSKSIVVAMLVGLVALAVLGIHVPGQLSEVLGHAARELTVTS